MMRRSLSVFILDLTLQLLSIGNRNIQSIASRRLLWLMEQVIVAVAVIHNDLIRLCELRHYRSDCQGRLWIFETEGLLCERYEAMSCALVFMCSFSIRQRRVQSDVQR